MLWKAVIKAVEVYNGRCRTDELFHDRSGKNDEDAVIVEAADPDQFRPPSVVCLLKRHRRRQDLRSVEAQLRALAKLPSLFACRNPCLPPGCIFHPTIPSTPCAKWTLIRAPIEPISMTANMLCNVVAEEDLRDELIF